MDDARAPRTSTFRVVEAAGFAGGAFIEPDWLIEDLIPAWHRARLKPLRLAQDGRNLRFDAAMQRGVAWRDEAMKCGQSVCVVAEGEYFFANRLRAHAEDRGVDVAELPAIVPSAINLRDSKQVRAFALELMKPRAAQIWFDTLQQCSPGSDENSVKNTGEILANLKYLFRTVGCRAGAIHDAGKSVEKGARGSSAWRPAVDTELYFESSDGISGSMRVEKSRDSAPGGVYPFERETIELGTCPNRKPITSVVVVQKDESPTVGRTRLTSTQKRGKDRVAQACIGWRPSAG